MMTESPPPVLKEGALSGLRNIPQSAGPASKPPTRWNGRTLLKIASSIACGLYLISTIRDAGVRQPASGKPPVVTVKNGSYTGVHSPVYSQDFFLGVPFAKPPDRFALAEPLNSSWTGSRVVNNYPKHCVGYGGDHIGFEASEDCLYLNVIRPAGLDSTADLPVAVWIHGGGLRMGGSADHRYNLSFIVQNSVRMGSPIIGISINYRLSAFGFIGGQEALHAGVANLGFRDQRLALRWVNENIAAFGGSPDKVTIFGESSGAESVTAQVLAYGGRNDGLFRGAIGQSGFGGLLYRFPGGLNATDKVQYVYDTLVASTSCAATIHTPASLECLRALPLAELHAALNETEANPWAPVLDGDFIADIPHNQLRDGRFPQIPILIGANSEEGTGFGFLGRSVNLDEDAAAAFAAAIGPQAERSTGKPLEQLVSEALYVYPNVQAVGVPGLDKYPVMNASDPLAAVVGLQGRRVAAFFGDMYMHYTRRRANLAWANHGLPSYSYRFDVTVNGIPKYIGATHFQEVAFVMNNLDGGGYAVPPIVDDASRALARTISTAWVNFIASLNPNGAQGTLLNGLVWPTYDLGSGGGVGQNVVWSVEGAGSYVETDAYRIEGINWMIDNGLTVFGN